MNIYQIDPTKQHLLNPFGYVLFGESALRDEAGRWIIARYEITGLPFALYLARWDVGITFGDEAAWMAYGDELYAPEQLYDKWARYLIQSGIPMVMIREKGLAFSEHAWCPAIALDDDTWEREVRCYVEQADLILVQPGFFGGPGIENELRMLREAGKQQCTVILLPALGDNLHVRMEKHRNVASFTGFDRVAYTDELPPTAIMDSPLIADIVVRMIAIANVPDELRFGLRDPDARQQAFALPPRPGVIGLAEAFLVHARAFGKMGLMQKCASFLDTAATLAQEASEGSMLEKIRAERSELLAGG